MTTLHDTNDGYHEITEEIQERIDALVAEPEHTTIGTVGPDWYPMVTKTLPMMYDGSIYLLMSDLSEHTRNIITNPEVAVYFAGSESHKVKMNNPRLTLQGRASRLVLDKHGAEYQLLLGEYCKRDPGAKMWGMFADFNFYRVDIERTHYVEGFAKAYQSKK